MKLKNLLTILVSMALLAGCVANPGDTKDLKKHSGPVKVHSEGQSPADLTEGRHIVTIKNLQNTAYVSLEDLTQAMGFNGAWLEDGTYGMGDNDPLWNFQTAESAATFSGESIQLPAPTVKEGNELYIPVSSLKQLFGDIAVFTIETDNVAFFPEPQPELEAPGGGQDFADDPDVSPTIASSSNMPSVVPVFSASQSADMIAYAKRYLGVKYKFGTGPYARSKRFDCSTFVQHVYGKYGKDMPRLSRQQATKGTYVPRTMLRRGDLLFFYVPGRFKRNKTVGHVGIYMGDGNMIHSSPRPMDGVQITPINKPYWKGTFLHAKRPL